jgi:hypothetical protein
MSWKSLPMWFRVFVIALLALFIVALLQDQIQKKKKLYNKWLATQKEIRELLIERRNLLLLIARVKKIAHVSTQVIKVILVICFFIFISILQKVYNWDIFTSTAAAGSFVGLVFGIVIMFVNSKIRNLNDLLDSLSSLIEKRSMKRYGVHSLQLDKIDVRLVELTEQSSTIKSMIRS